MAYITRTTGNPMTNQKIFTYSAWLKITDLGTYQRPIQNYYDGNNRGYILFCSSSDSAANTFFLYDKEGGTINYQANTTAKFRDTNAWYHIVYRVDSTQATQSDRVRFYVNGVQQSLSISTNVGQNVNMGFNSAGANLRIGGTEAGAETWKGVMSHVHFCDGYSYAPTEFGETDSTTGEWKIKTTPNVTYGNNGFWVFKNDAAVTDRSGEGNNFTLSGSITPTVDNPSNNFATLTPLYTFDSALAYTKGNTVVAYSGSGADSWTTRYAISSLGMMSGKYYAETKIAAIGTNQMYVMGIISDPSANAVNSSIGYLSNAYAYYTADGRIIAGASDLQTGIGTATTNDIVGLAFDADNGTMQLYKNGSAIGSQVTGISVGDRTWHFASNFYSTGKIAWNFGNGYFEETAVSSAGTNASNIGTFEYDVPSGYTALCTKGLNE